VAPFNVNYRYVGEELRYLLNDARPRALILHSSLAPTLADVLPTLDAPPDVLLQVEDESGHPLLAGAEWYEEALAKSSPDGAAVDPSPDDLYILYTGGTTGMPKGVLWRQHDIFMAAMGGRKVGTWEVVTSYDGLVERLTESFPLKLMLLPPLMHGAAQWAAFMLWAQGATLVFPDDTRRVDPDDVWSTVEREQANTMTIVGDAILRPLLLQLDKKQYDLSSFFAVGNGGAPLTPAVRAMALERLPTLVSRPGRRRDVHPRSGHRRRRRDALDRARARPRGQRLAGADRKRAAGVSRRRGQDGAHLPRDRRGALLHPGGPGPAPGGRGDPVARARLGHRQLRR
jgi:fatty-acyl-CoA synthase